MKEKSIGWKITLLVALSEGVLFLFSLPWLNRTVVPFPPDIFPYIQIGILCSLPLLIISILLSVSMTRWAFLQSSALGRQLQELQRDYIFPLSSSLRGVHIFLIAILSGIGEEVFFRGLLTWLLSSVTMEIFVLLFVNVAFALVHFIGNFYRFSWVIPIYFAAGIYLSIINIYFDNIIVPIACHAFFNFCSLLLNRHWAKTG